MGRLLASNPLKRQSGVALISVLLVFALATVIASEVISRNFRDIRRTANTINAKQAYYYSLGGEQFARQILYRDFIDDQGDKSDALTDSWAQSLDVFEIENGRMSIEIIDLQSRFNLNNLVNNRNSGRAAAQFSKLLELLGISTEYTTLLQDWIDPDRAAIEGGAEDTEYQTGNTGYLTANREMSDRSELRLLRGLSAEDYNTLKDYVVALPSGTTYNLNTLDAKIVEALSVNISNSELSSIKRQQQAGGYKLSSQWLDTGEATRLAFNRDQLDVRSEYFEVVVKTVYDERTSVVRTQLYRNKENADIEVLKRQQGFE